MKYNGCLSTVDVDWGITDRRRSSSSSKRLMKSRYEFIETVVSREARTGPVLPRHRMLRTDSSCAINYSHKAMKVKKWLYNSTYPENCLLFFYPLGRHHYPFTFIYLFFFFHIIPKVRSQRFIKAKMGTLILFVILVIRYQSVIHERVGMCRDNQGVSASSLVSSGSCFVRAGGSRMEDSFPPKSSLLPHSSYTRTCLFLHLYIYLFAWQAAFTRTSVKNAPLAIGRRPSKHGGVWYVRSGEEVHQRCGFYTAYFLPNRESANRRRSGVRYTL